MRRAVDDRFAAAQRAIAHREQRLVALSPDGVLARGYSITHDAESGAVIRTAGETAKGRCVRIRLGAGRIGAAVDEVDA
jgi:exodeoxyribonuclease VII large subunit